MRAGDKLQDDRIVELYWNREETAIDATEKKYGAYLMKKYDTSWGQDTARPFIMENDALMKGYR